MHTENSIVIDAPLRLVYDLAAAVERWPSLLPHYRYVRIRETRGSRRLVEMAARRGWIPVWWMAVQECDRTAPRVRFRHVRGVTGGMAVEWSFAPEPGGTRVTIRHDFRPPWPIVGGLVADTIIGPHFVEAIAARTLAGLKAHAEVAAPATRGADAIGEREGDR